MKKSLIAAFFIVCASIAFSQKTPHSKKQQKIKVALTKYTDNIDDRMKGPKGEVIYIGANGGRYYIKQGKKIYVEYKGNKRK